MRKAKADPAVNKAIDSLKKKTLLEQEFAYSIERTYSNTTNGQVYNVVPRVGENFQTTVPVGGDNKGQAHNHPINGQSIPSFGDVKWLRECQQNIFPQTGISYNIVVCANPASPNNPSTAIVYAITVDTANLPELSAQVDAMWNRDDLQGKDDDEKRDKLNFEYAEKFADVQNSSAGMEKKFLELYQDFGINLMRVNPATQKWEKLIIENNNVKSIPCE